MKTTTLLRTLMISTLILGLTPTALIPAAAAETTSTETVTQPVTATSVTLTSENANIKSGKVLGFKADWLAANTDAALGLINGGTLIFDSSLGDSLSVDTKAFSLEHLRSLLPKTTNATGISKVTFPTTAKSLTVGYQAFANNQLTTVELPKSLSGRLVIGDGAFMNNQIETLEVPKNVKTSLTIGNKAFMNNRLETLEFPKTTYSSVIIGDQAFANNRIDKVEFAKFVHADQSYLRVANQISVGAAAFANNAIDKLEIPVGTKMASTAFSNQIVTMDVTTDDDGNIAFGELLPNLVAVTNNDGSRPLTAEENLQVTVVNGGLTAENNQLTGLSPSVEFATATVNIALKNAAEIGGYSIRPLTLNIENDAYTGSNTGGNTDNGGGSTGGGSTTTPEPAPTPETTPDVTPIVPISSDPVIKKVKHPYKIYAKRAMRLHKTVELNQPLQSFKKQARTKAKTFTVLGVSYSKGGAKRYRVAGGYVTANPSYVANLYYQSNTKRIRVISTKGINQYKTAKLTGKVRTTKRNQVLKVKRLIKTGKATRYQLTNGNYVSANKQLVIWK